MMQDVILAALRIIEQERGIKIIYACEAGSRAWGFASKDSDYDVRVIFVRPLEDYLRVHSLDDNFEHKLTHEIDGKTEVLDIAGWDLRKALGLLSKGNSPLVEWLTSPIRYLCPDLSLLADLLVLHNQFYNKRAVLYHYVNMAFRCYTEHLVRPEVKLKKYFYAIRPLLAATYVLNDVGRTPPVDFMTLFNSLGGSCPLPGGNGVAAGVIRDSFVKQKILDLYNLKISGSSEGDKVVVDPELLSWIDAQVTFIKQIIPTIPVKELLSKEAFASLDNLLYRMVTADEKRVSGLEGSA